MHLIDLCSHDSAFLRGRKSIVAMPALSGLLCSTIIVKKILIISGDIKMKVNTARKLSNLLLCTFTTLFSPKPNGSEGHGFAQWLSSSFLKFY